jgi:hypothetical protein
VPFLRNVIASVSATQLKTNHIWSIELLLKWSIHFLTTLDSNLIFQKKEKFKKPRRLKKTKNVAPSKKKNNNQKKITDNDLQLSIKPTNSPLFVSDTHDLPSRNTELESKHFLLDGLDSQWLIPLEMEAKILINPHVDILKDMKELLNSHGLSLQEDPTKAIIHSAFRGDLIIPDLPEEPQAIIKAKKGMICYYHVLISGRLADCASKKGMLCVFCDDPFPLVPSPKLKQLGDFLMAKSKLHCQWEPTNPWALRLPVRSFPSFL